MSRTEQKRSLRNWTIRCVFTFSDCIGSFFPVDDRRSERNPYVHILWITINNIPCTKNISEDAHERVCQWDNVILTRSTRYYRVTLEEFFSRVSNYRFASYNVFLQRGSIAPSEFTVPMSYSKKRTLEIVSCWRPNIYIFQRRTVLNRLRSHEQAYAGVASAFHI